MEKVNIQYCITELVEDAYKFNYDAVSVVSDMNALQFQFEHSFVVSPEAEQLTVTMRVRLLNGADELVLQGVRASFITSPFHHFVNDMADGRINVSNPLLIDTFISICIGAARGMLAKNLRGTSLEGVVLPLIPMSVIRENSSVK